MSDAEDDYDDESFEVDAVSMRSASPRPADANHQQSESTPIAKAGESASSADSKAEETAAESEAKTVDAPKPDMSTAAPKEEPSSDDAAASAPTVPEEDAAAEQESKTAGNVTGAEDNLPADATAADPGPEQTSASGATGTSATVAGTEDAGAEAPVDASETEEKTGLAAGDHAATPPEDGDEGEKSTSASVAGTGQTGKQGDSSVLLEFPAVTAGSQPRPLRISSEAASHPAIRCMLRANGLELDAWIRRASLEEHAAPVDAAGRTLVHCLALKSKTSALVALLRAGGERLRARRDASRDAARERAVAAKQAGADTPAGIRAALIRDLDAAERLYHTKREEHARKLLASEDEDGRTPLHYACAARGGAARCLLEALPVAGMDLAAVGPSGLPLFPPGAYVDTRTGLLFNAPAEFAGVAVAIRSGDGDGIADLLSTLPRGLASPFRPRKAAGFVGDGCGSRPLTPPSTRPPTSRRHAATRDDDCSALGSRSGPGEAPSNKAAPLSPVKPRVLLGRTTNRAATVLGGASASGEAFAPDGTPRLAVDDVPAWRAAWVDAADCDAHTSLHIASAMSDAAATRLLVSAGANRYAQSVEGETPMSLATADAVRRVLLPITDAVENACEASAAGAGGGDSRRPTPTERDALTDSQMLDMASGPLRALRLLLSTGANPNARSGTLVRAPLHVAAEAGQPEVVSVLLQSGAEAGVVDANGWTPLALAVFAGTGRLCCSPRHVEVVRRLLAAGAAVEATTSMRRTALHLAALMQGSYAADEWERWRRSSESRRDDDDAADAGRSVAGAHGEAEEHGSEAAEDEAEPERPPPGASMLWLLLEHGASPERKDDEGMTPLLHACRHGCVEAAAALLACGASLEAATSRGTTALHLAAKHGHRDVCRLLARHDAERGRLKRALDSSGRSPVDLAKDAATREAMDTLWEAAAAGRLDMTQRLLRAAVRVPAGSSGEHLPVRVWDKTVGLGRTALHALMTGAAAAIAEAVSAAAAAASAAHGAPGRVSQRLPGASAAARRMRNIVAGIGLRVGSRGGAAAPAVTRDTGRARKSDVIARAQEPFARVAALLVANGADPDAADLDGVTPVMLAARFGLAMVLRPLLPKCALATADGCGNTALHWAHAYSQQIVIAMLEDEGADKAAANAEGATPVEVAGVEAALIGAASSEADLGADKVSPKVSATLRTTRLRTSSGKAGASI